MIRAWTSLRGYVCRGCGHEVAYQSRFRKCPVCGIKWG
jgi:rubrerythrin